MGWVTAPYCHPGTSWKDAGPEKEEKGSNTQHILTPQLCTARRKAARGQEAAPKGGEGEMEEPRGAAGTTTSCTSHAPKSSDFGGFSPF